MEITLSKGIFKKSLSVLMAFLIAMSTMWMGLSMVSFAVDERGVTYDNVTAGNITAGDVTDGNVYTTDRAIELDKNYAVRIESGYITCVEFVPEVYGKFAFRSYSNGDAYGYIFDENFNQLARNDDFNGRNFYIEYDLEKGKTYYLGARFYNRRNSGSFNVNLSCIEVYCNHEDTVTHPREEASCYENGFTEGVYCNECESWISGHERIEANHKFDLTGFCTVCSAENVTSGNCGQEVKYELHNDGRLVIFGSGPMWDYWWGEASPFYNSSVKSVVIKEGVTTIGYYAFSDCDSLTEVTIGDGVTYIGGYAFYNCYNLESITIPDSVTTIGNYAFEYCYSLREVTIGDGVTTIGDYAFYSCDSLESVTIPDSVTKIDSTAFSRLTVYCNKNSAAETYAKNKNYPYVLLDGGDEVNIVGGSIGKNFTWSLDKRTGLLEVAGSGKLPYFTDESPAPWEEYRDYITQVSLPEGLLIISSKAFENLNRIRNITIPDSVTIIGDSAFYNCDSLTEVTIPDSVTTIGDYAFAGSPLIGRSLTKVTIGDSVTTIGDYAFYYCDSLTKVTIGDSVTTIGDEAFSYCKSLTEVIIPDSVTTIGDYAFYSCDSLESVYASDIESWLKISFNGYSANPMHNGADLYVDGELVTDLVIPDSVTTIGSYAFYNCDSLETVKFNIDENYESKITYIPSGAFTGCSNLKEVVLPASVKNIRSNSFPSTLEKITIYNPECEIDLACGITYNSEVIGFKGSTAETFADEKAAYFTDIETIHSHSYKVISDTKATCTEDGLYLERCSCGKENKEVRAKTGHKFKDYEVTLQPTCTSYGEQKAFCENCDYYEMQHISPTYHKNRESRPQQNPTCTSYGYTSGVYCPDCKTWISGHAIINTAGHSFTEKIIDDIHFVSAATATSPALYRYDCANCDAIGSETFTYGEAIGLGRPATLTATQTTNSITLTWSAVKEASGYLVFRWLGSSWQACALTDGTSCTLTGLAAGTKYKYAVIAYGSGNGNVVIANAYTTVETVTKAAAPSKVSATQSTSAIKLSWTACSGATGYRIYYKSGNTWKVSVSSTTATSHTYTGLKAGAKYTFAVRPYIKNGSEIIWSDYVEYSAATTPATVTAKATSSATGKIALSWNQVNGADGYQVYYKTGNGSYKLYKTVSASTNSLNFSNLKSGTKYSFAVRAGIKTSGGNIFGAYKEAAVTVR